MSTITSLSPPLSENNNNGQPGTIPSLAVPSSVHNVNATKWPSDVLNNV